MKSRAGAAAAVEAKRSTRQLQRERGWNLFAACVLVVPVQTLSLLVPPDNNSTAKGHTLVFSLQRSVKI